ncbi:MAG TPA: hypothetical protein VM901_00645 [Bdellovibrionota bacterium]|jgi:hypothetical protein|nr:hypothetical protein [Bdellovibrionota bacterium]
MFRRYAPLLLSGFVGVISACSPRPDAPVPEGSRPPSQSTLLASPKLLESPFVQEWIRMMDAPLLALDSTQIKFLCDREAVLFELAKPLSCENAIDLPKLGDAFEARCPTPNSLELKLRPKAICNAATLMQLRQKAQSGPLRHLGSRLEPNVANYPLLAQVPPIEFSPSSAPQLEMPNTEAWLRTMGSSGAVRIVLKPAAKHAGRSSLEPLARSLAALEAPRKFSPQVKYTGPSGASTPQKIAQPQILWSPAEANMDATSERVCAIVSGWIDYQLMQIPADGTKAQTFELQCALELESPLLWPNSKNEIEVGRLSFPLTLSKSGTYPFSTLSEALSPSALLGLRLDL